MKKHPIVIVMAIIVVRNSCCCRSQDHEKKCTDPITTTKYMLEKAFYTALMQLKLRKLRKK